MWMVISDRKSDVIHWKSAIVWEAAIQAADFRDENIGLS